MSEVSFNGGLLAFIIISGLSAGFFLIGIIMIVTKWKSKEERHWQIKD
ncbi:MAG: hypothetical protein K0S44_191 [Bacteroidetes bacterium]|jgi:hypothetical protein|nr:hypothetical protein [Bacteroidota bacterium]